MPQRLQSSQADGFELLARFFAVGVFRTAKLVDPLLNARASLVWPPAELAASVTTVKRVKTAAVCRIAPSLVVDSTNVLL